MNTNLFEPDLTSKSSGPVVAQIHDRSDQPASGFGRVERIIACQVFIQPLVAQGDVVFK